MKNKLDPYECQFTIEERKKYHRANAPQIKKSR